ncbi:hypothetical protein GWN63_05550, partial [Candidatus Bathyarchaeota archaeon]|nr:hypothetical protein [Candidatus Bathyarchaeota archaeon]NIU81689.1 hypothetical protein [Candidatus Bathyarchaeota archaeon]NIV68335.1 hypothetical protein [Candidatus Bathyarchaeota archaeon]NIW34873.1 hypothetical protein [Candidatus Bathyarchaeota archaeon]
MEGAGAEVVVEHEANDRGEIGLGRSDEELHWIKEKKLKNMLQNLKGGGVEMNERIVIPVLEEGGLEARLSEHFGRAPFFAVIDLGENGEVSNQKTVPNRSEHFGGTGHPPQRILQLKPSAVITFGMGPRGLGFFQRAQVAV